MLGNPNTPQGERSLEDTEKESEEEGAAAGAAEEVWMEAVLGKGHGWWGAWPCLGLRPTAWTGKSWLQVGIPGPWAARGASCGPVMVSNKLLEEQGARCPRAGGCHVGR